MRGVTAMRRFAFASVGQSVYRREVPKDLVVLDSKEGRVGCKCREGNL